MARISSTPPLVLGSASPRRRAILETLGVAHVVVAADADEALLPGEGPAAYLERVARAKLLAVQRRLAVEGLAAPSSVILVADTTVVDGDASLGKPSDRDDAERLVARLAGRTHEVRTRFVLGLADAAASHGVLHEETVATAVTFRPLAPGEARAYAATGEGMDKAGGYAIQGLAQGFVARIDGSYSNVVGLPACELVVALARLGLR